MKVLLVVVNILLFLIGSYFIYESIMQKNIYNSLKKRKPEKIKVNLYKKGKYEFEFSNNITTKYTIPYFALVVPVSKDNFLHAGNDNKIKTLGCSYEIYNTNNKQVFSKELEFNDICFVKTTRKQLMLHLGSIKWLPNGKYKIVFNVYSPCSEIFLNGCDLLFIRHIASGELTGTIFLYQLLGVSFFVVGIIFYVFRSLLCRKRRLKV